MEKEHEKLRYRIINELDHIMPNDLNNKYLFIHGMEVGDGSIDVWSSVQGKDLVDILTETMTQDDRIREAVFHAVKVFDLYVKAKGAKRYIL